MIDFGASSGSFTSVQSDQVQFDTSNLSIDGTVVVVGGAGVEVAVEAEAAPEASRREVRQQARESRREARQEARSSRREARESRRESRRQSRVESRQARRASFANFSSRTVSAY